MSYTDNLPISGQTKCWAWSGSTLFGTLFLFLKESFQNVNFEEKNIKWQKKMKKNIRWQKMKINQHAKIFSSTAACHNAKNSGCFEPNVPEQRPEQIRPEKHWAWSGSILIGTLFVFLKESFEMLIWKNDIIRWQKRLKITQHAKN